MTLKIRTIPTGRNRVHKRGEKTHTRFFETNIGRAHNLKVHTSSRDWKKKKSLQFAYYLRRLAIRKPRAFGRPPHNRTRRKKKKKELVNYRKRYWVITPLTVSPGRSDHARAVRNKIKKKKNIRHTTGIIVGII